MPSSEEILEQFRVAQANASTSDPVRDEVMARKLEALMKEPHPEKSAQMAYDLMCDYSDSAMGVAVCQCLLNKPDGVKLATNVGRAVTTAEMGKVTNVNAVESFLRGNSSASTFSKEFISQTSPNYVDSIKQKAQQLARKHDVDNLATMSEPERLQAMIGLTKDMKSLACNTDELSAESKQYLSALNQGVQDDDGFAARFSQSTNISLEEAQATQNRLGSIAINNSAALRFVMSEVTTNPQLNQNRYWKNCAQIAQKSFNLNQVDGLGQGSDGNYKLITGNDSPNYPPRYDEISVEKRKLNEQIKTAKEQGLDTVDLEGQVNALEIENQEVMRLGDIAKKQEVDLKTQPFLQGVHTLETRQEVTDMMTRLKDTDLPEELGLDFKGAHQTTAAERQVNDERMTQEVKDINTLTSQIKQLEERKQKLSENPSIKDRIKGFFNHGLKGVQGEIAKIEKEITANQTAKEDIQKGVTVEQRQEIVNRMKHNQGAIAHEMGVAKGVVVTKNLETSMPSMGSSVSDKDVDEAITRHTGLESAQKELSGEIKTQEKVLKVREALGKGPETPKVEAPKISRSVK